MSNAAASSAATQSKRAKLSKFPDKLEIQSPIPNAKLIYGSLGKTSFKGEKLSLDDGHQHSLRNKWPSSTKSLTVTSSIISIEKKTSQDSLYRKNSTANPSQAISSQTKISKSISTSFPQKEKLSAATNKDHLKKAITKIVSPKSVTLSISTATTKPNVAFNPHSPKNVASFPSFITSKAIISQPPALASVFSSSEGHGLTLPEVPENPDM